MKKITLLLVITLLITLTGCKSKEEITGGYTLENSVAGTLPENAKAAFDEATKDDSHSYEPLALLSAQVVSGTNFAILVKEKDELKILIIYKPISGETKITSKSEFNMLDYLTKNINIVKDEETLMGGWNVPEDGGLTKMPQELATSSYQAFQDLDEINLEPLCLLGTQVVSGINYALICRGKVTNKYNLYMVELYVDTNSNPKVITIEPIDIKQYTK